MIHKTILITGAGGTIGREIVLQLLNSPVHYNIRIFDLPNLKNKEFFGRFPDQIQTFWGDISKKEDTIEACKDVDIVLHLAGIIPPKAYDMPNLVKEVNIKGTKYLIENLELYSPNAFLCYASSVAVYGDRLDAPYIEVGDPLVPSLEDNYARSKIQSEKLIQNSNIQWSIFRLSAVFGVDNHKMSSIMFLMPLETPIEIVTPKDVARAFTNAVEHREELVGRVFNLGGGKKNRVVYKDLLAAYFKFVGLGELDFPIHAFAIQNYHCGYYNDSDELENILHFRKDTLQSLYRQINDYYKWPVKIAAKLTHKLVKSYLLSKSDPYKGWVEKDPYKLYKYFGIDVREEMKPTVN